MQLNFYDSDDDKPFYLLMSQHKQKQSLRRNKEKKEEESSSNHHHQQAEKLQKIKNIILYDPQWQYKLVEFPSTAATYADYCQFYQQTPPKPNPPPSSSESRSYSWPTMTRLGDPEILEVFPYIAIIYMIKPSNTFVNETLAVFDMFVSSTKCIRGAKFDPKWQEMLISVSEEAKLWLDKARLLSPQDGYFKL